MTNQRTNFWLNIELFLRRKPVLATCMALLTLLLMLAFIYSAYRGHQDIVVRQQQEHLLTIARTVARNLELFVQEKTQTTQMYFEEFAALSGKSEQPSAQLELGEAIRRFYTVQKQYMDSICFMDCQGRICYRQGRDNERFIPVELRNVRSTFIRSLVERKQTVVGPLFKDESANFWLSVIKPLYIGEQLHGFIICAISLDKIYRQIVAPTRVGKQGYILVKDQNRRIIMHQVKEQLGLDVLKGRSALYPNLDYQDLKKVIQKQMTGKTGTTVYYSYWWNQKHLSKVQKINAYTPAWIGEQFWVLSVAVDYHEVETPVKKNLDNILLLSFVILLILSSAIFTIMRLIKNTQTLELETRYLKELNKSAAELQKSESKARHYQKLQTIGSLAGGIAHEFNNLLTPILGYSEIILKNIAPDSDIGADVSEIHTIARKAADLVKQILMYGRLDTGMHVFKPLQIDGFVKESLRMIKKVFPSSIRIVEKINPNCGYIYANATMINQILLNLCTNAYHAMKGTQGTLTIELEKISSNVIGGLLGRSCENEAYIMLRMTDTGCGMDEETQLRIFEPFFTTKDTGEGTGLGLWLVESIVREHRGEIRVQSKKGEGSIFTLYFPWLTDRVPEEKTVPVFWENREHLCVILVEDETEIIKVLKKGLQKLGYSVYGEPDPVSAIARFKANPEKYDVIVTDYTMPKISGLELAALIKNIRKNIKVLLMTGFVEKNVEELMANSDIDGFLSKPFSCDDLDRKLQTLFMERR